MKEEALLVAAFTLLSSAASGTVSAQSLDGGTDAGLDAAVGDAAVGDAAVGDAAVGDGGLTDASVVDAFVPPSYFNDLTAQVFPNAPCADLVGDAGSRLGCFTSWLTLSDLDSDGDLDVLFANGGGYYQIGNAEPSTIYTNDGTGAFRDVTTLWFGGAVNRNRQVSVGDIDGDGDLDIYQPGGYGLDLDKLWVQTAPRVFENRAATNLPGKLKSKAGASHLGDLDGDGDLDLAVADWGDIPLTSSTLATPANVWIYLNNGKGSFSQQPASVVPPPIPVAQGRAPIDLDFSDVDGDFDLDILVNMRNGQSRLFLNDGTAHFTDGTQTLVRGADPILNYPRKRGPYTYNQEMCDIDYDGDLDMLLDNAGVRPEGITRGNFTQVNINDGKGHFEDKTREMIFGEVGSDDNAVKCADINGDGKYDMVVAALQTRGEKLLLNDGTGIFNDVPNAFPALRDPTLGIDIADLDGDGKLDVITGQGEGSDWVDKYYKGIGLSGKDVTPPTFRTIEEPDFIEPNTPIVIRLAPIDGTTSETGEHVKAVSVSYQVNGGAAKTLKATFIGGDLFRVVIPAQPNGTILTLNPSATDRAGLVSAPLEVSLLVGEPVVEPPPPAPDSGVEPEPDAGMEPVEVDAGTDPEPEPEPEVDASVDEEPAPTPTADAGASGDGDSEEEDEEDDDGCSVAAAGSGGNNTGSGLLFALGLTVLAVRRSRIARRRS